MKVEVIKNEEQEISYPWLGVSIDGLVVYFYRECCGVVLLDDGKAGERNGMASGAWDMRRFRPFTGKLVLSNE